MTLKEELRAKIVDVAEWMQMINEFTNSVTPIPVMIDGRTYALALHPIEQPKPEEGEVAVDAPVPDENGNVPEAAEEHTNEAIDEFLG